MIRKAASASHCWNQASLWKAMVSTKLSKNTSARKELKTKAVPCIRQGLLSASSTLKYLDKASFNRQKYRLG